MAARPETSRTQSTARHAAWQALQEHQRVMRGRHLRALFADDPARGERMTVEAAGVFLDYSKNRIDDETLRLLIELAPQGDRRAGAGRCWSSMWAEARSRSFALDSTSPDHLRPGRP